MAYRGLLRPTGAYHSLSRPTAAYRGLPRPVEAYCSLQETIGAYRGLLRPPETYCSLPRSTTAQRDLRRRTGPHRGLPSPAGPTRTVAHGEPRVARAVPQDETQRLREPHVGVLRGGGGGRSVTWERPPPIPARLQPWPRPHTSSRLRLLPPRAAILRHVTASSRRAATSSNRATARKGRWELWFSEPLFPGPHPRPPLPPLHPSDFSRVSVCPIWGGLAPPPAAPPSAPPSPGAAAAPSAAGRGPGWGLGGDVGQGGVLGGQHEGPEGSEWYWGALWGTGGSWGVPGVEECDTGGTGGVLQGSGGYWGEKRVLGDKEGDWGGSLGSEGD